MNGGTGVGRRRGRGALVASLVLVVLVLAAGGMFLVHRRTPAAGPPPNIVLVSVESLRADHVGCYGYPRPTTPVLDRLAQESMVYENVDAVTTWTLASHASIFTGLYPTAHQTTDTHDTLDDSYTTLAELLARRGYQTAAVVSGPYLRKPYNLVQGFEYLDDLPSALTVETAHGNVTNPAMDEALERFLREKRDPARPLFLFAYFWDPHYDYLPPPPYDRAFLQPGDEHFDIHGYELSSLIRRDMPPARLSYVISQYDGEILWTDVHLGRLFERLRTLGLWDSTLLVVTGDHGEEFFEHGFKGHKNNLHRESLQVPLLVKHPGSSRRGRDPRPASLVDLLPTVLELTGTRYAGPVHGRSLLEPGPDPERPVYSELEIHWRFPQAQPGAPKEVRGRQLGVRKGRYRQLTMEKPAFVGTYDFARDPYEHRNLSDELPGVVGELVSLRDAWQADMRSCGQGFRRGGPVQLEPEEVERLRSLGYIH